ncbi:hypothetical protein Y695_01893 [Hydrogenophaga sp. T4]|nr:hypothetical protein Y695_01893 [Hydrogenophaga sp. T4]
MDFIYLGLAAACGLVIWGLALVCQRLQPTEGRRA